VEEDSQRGQATIQKLEASPVTGAQTRLHIKKVRPAPRSLYRKHPLRRRKFLPSQPLQVSLSELRTLCVWIGNVTLNIYIVTCVRARCRWSCVPFFSQRQIQTCTCHMHSSVPTTTHIHFISLPPFCCPPPAPPNTHTHPPHKLLHKHAHSLTFAHSHSFTRYLTHSLALSLSFAAGSLSLTHSFCGTDIQGVTVGGGGGGSGGGSSSFGNSA